MVRFAPAFDLADELANATGPVPYALPSARLRVREAAPAEHRETLSEKGQRTIPAKDGGTIPAEDRHGPGLEVPHGPGPGDHYGPRLQDRQSPGLQDRSAPVSPGLSPAASAPASPVNPFDDADALEELEAEITSLAAHIHAATHRLLTLIADFDRRRGWELGGHRTCAHWLSARTGIHLGAAREKVRTARALAGLPLTSASMSRGELSFSKVRALSRVATPDNESDLLPLARGCTTAQLERMVRGFQRESRRKEADLEEFRHRSRRLSVYPDLDGMYVVRGRLTPEVGALLMRAVEAAGDALFRKEWEAEVGRTVTAGAGAEAGSMIDAGSGSEAAPHSEDPPHAHRETESLRKAARRRADALGLLAERALAAGFGTAPRERPAEAGGRTGGLDTAPDGGEEPGHGSAAATDSNEAPGAVAGARTPAPISGSRAERYQVVLHVDAQTLQPHGDTGRSALDDGTRVSAETSRRLSCDAGLVTLRHGPDGSILDGGRRTRTVSPALRRALDARDRGCRFPGCGLRFTDAHHVTHWAEGGQTRLDNLVLLCRHHHRLVHEGGWTVGWWGEGRPVFFDPRGGTHFDGRWQMPEVGDTPVQDLMDENRRRGGHTITPRPATWEREADIPDPVYFQALEAMAEADP